MTITTELESLFPALEEELGQANSLQDVETLEVNFLGRKGKLSALMAKLPQLSAEERPAFGRQVNLVKENLTKLISDKRKELEVELEAKSLAFFDPSLPGRQFWQGSRHPLMTVMNDICAVFASLGYEVVSGPEVETDFNNFEALNFPKDHPSRDMQDTFYISNNTVLRTHTSPMQVRAMLERKKPPVAVIAPGKVYRKDSDVTHSPMFHQIEGLLVMDGGVNLSHLRGTLTMFVQRLFGADVDVRFRSSFFPFTEPSVEVDMSCILCQGTGRIHGEPCRICKTTGWLEILGSGMVDPEVFKHVGFSEECTGFAFGLGVERVTMLKYGITDIRMFFENDLRLLKQLPS